MKTILLFILVLLQGSMKAQQLGIGDVLPPFTINEITNYPEQYIDNNEIKGKLVIFDFWSTNCTSCVAAFPKLDSMQQQFKDQLQIFLITKQPKKLIDQFFIKHKKIKRPNLPIITGDSILSKFFPYVYVPHHVWVDSVGKVRYITDGYNTNESTVRGFLNGKKFELNEKQYVTNPVINPLSVLSDERWKDKVAYSSVLTNCLSGITFSNSIRQSPGYNYPNYISQNCAPISRLYAIAFGEGEKYNFNANNTVEINVKDISKYVYPSKQEELNYWTRANSYNYNLQIPPTKGEMVYKIMQQDMIRFFGATARLEKRKIDCLVLVRTSAFNKLKTKGGEPSSNFWVMDESEEKYFRNMDFSFFSAFMRRVNEAHWRKMPFVDETGIKGNVDISILSEVKEGFDINEFRRQLRRYDLDLVIKRRVQNVLIISEPDFLKKKR